MYHYQWDKRSRGYLLTTQSGKYVASEIRPVYAEELNLLGFDEYFQYDKNETAPLMWAKQNSYIYSGEEIGKLVVDENNELKFSIAKELTIKKLNPVNIKAMVEKNRELMDLVTADSLKRIKEMYNEYEKKCDVVYIGFSGGKDSMLLLDLCHKVLPITVPVVFSDTDMELPDTYLTWELVQKRYEGRPFIKVKAEKSAVDNWELFGPPAQNLRWCCSVHKSTPAVLQLREISKNPSAKTLAFVGVRSDESLKRSTYDDIGDGLKNQSQVNAMPILNWGTHELFLYTFEHDLIINPAYKKGIPRVGCLLCPMSSERQALLIAKLYPKKIAPFIDQIKNSTFRNFPSDKDFDNFIFSGGWHARKNGVALKNAIIDISEKHTMECLKYSFTPIKRENFAEWLKTVGELYFEDEPNRMILKIADESYNITLDLGNNNQNISQVECNIKNLKNCTQLAKLLKSTIQKALSCVGCQACVSECPMGALSFSDGVKVDTEKCIHCLKCHNIDKSCWRYKSMVVPNRPTSKLKSIGNYQTFGLRENWIQVYCEEGETFAKNNTIGGGPMIDSAKIWFRQAMLTKDAKSLEPGKIMKLPAAYGSDNELFWSLVWIALSNNSPLIKWVVTNIPFYEKVSADEINLRLGDLSASAKRGGMQALFNFFKNSPIGVGAQRLVELELKGTRVTGVKRIRKSIEPLAVLYSLYLMAQISGRTAFTLSEMMNGDFDSPFISPLLAFGMEVGELKTQCQGLAAVYPKFISCTFTLGLDEVKIYPEEKSLDDVVDLILNK